MSADISEIDQRSTFEIVDNAANKLRDGIFNATCALRLIAESSLDPAEDARKALLFMADQIETACHDVTDQLDVARDKLGKPAPVHDND